MNIKCYDRMTVYRFKEFKNHSIYALKRFTNLVVILQLSSLNVIQFMRFFFFLKLFLPFQPMR